MSWVHAESAEGKSFYVRANDIAEVEMGTDDRVCFRRRGHPYQYVAKGADSVNHLMEMITATDAPGGAPLPPPQPVPQPIPEPPPRPARPQGCLRVLAALEDAPMWQPQLRAALGGSTLALKPMGALIRFGQVDEHEGLYTITAKGKRDLATARERGELLPV